MPREASTTACAATAVRSFRLESSGATGHARFTNGLLSLVRHRVGWKWEFYLVVQAGPSRGLEMFVRYLRDHEAVHLERVLAAERDRQHIETTLAELATRQALRGCAVDVVTEPLVD